MANARKTKIAVSLPGSGATYAMKRTATPISSGGTYAKNRTATPTSTSGGTYAKNRTATPKATGGASSKPPLRRKMNG